MTGADPYNLHRFVEAQRSSYARVLKELGAGRKESHWMWYIFPQIEGLGSSEMARKYAISSLDEAKAYLRDALLGTRLRECTQLVAAVSGASIEEILGHPDNLKFHSSMTLFAHAAPDDRIFLGALKKYFRSEYDRRTTERL